MKVPYISTRKREWLQTLQNSYGSANVLLDALRGGKHGKAAQIAHVSNVLHREAMKSMFAGCTAVALNWDGGDYQGKHVNIALGINLDTFVGANLVPVVFVFGLSV